MYIHVDMLLLVAVPIICMMLCIYLRVQRRHGTRDDMKGEVVLITGAAGGLGSAMAYAFASLGASLVLWDVNDVELKRLLDHLHIMYGDSNMHKEEKQQQQQQQQQCFIGDVVDVGSHDDVNRAALHSIEAMYGHTPSVLINNAAVVSAKPLLLLTHEQIQRSMAVNTLSHFWTIKAFVPLMVKRHYGHVVTVASVFGFMGAHSLSDYCASKAAICGLHDSLTLELSENHGVHTTLLCPARIKTSMFEGVVDPLPGLTPDYVASRVVTEVLSRRTRVLFLPMIFNVMPLWYIIPVYIRKLVAKFAGTSTDKAIGRCIGTNPSIDQ